MVKRCICIHHPTFDDDNGIEDTKRLADVLIEALKATMNQNQITGGMSEKQKQEMKSYLKQFRFMIKKIPKDILK